MTFEDWMFFMSIWIVASIPLGPNALNCVATSATHGFKTGLWSVLGVFIAALIHMSVAATGIATFLNANPVLFEILRWLGVGYLAWMGVSMFRSDRKLQVEPVSTTSSKSRLVRNAILISMSNPKAIFTWLAIFSQFVDPVVPLGEQLAVLAPSALSVTLLVYIGYCALGLGVERVFSGQRKRWFDRITGSTYIAFAAGLAAADLRRS